MNNEHVFIIAELSANHGGDINIAKRTIDAAKAAGADAIKLQTYTADTMTINVHADDFIINSGTIWDGRQLFELYEEAYTPWEWHKELFDYARKLELVCFSSPFDISAVDFLETLDCPIYKIASFEITDIPLIAYVASKGKPMIISTGIATYDDIELAVNTCRDNGCTDITILKCTSSYPAPIEQANMRLMQQIQQDFDVKVGLSDHTEGTTLPVVATSIGARVIEKHFILDKSIGGPDASFSLDKDEFELMVTEVRKAESALGSATYLLTDKQKSGKSFARSLYIAQDMKKGEPFTPNNLRSVRPGFGLHPKYYSKLLGKKVNQDVTKGTRVSLDLLDENIV